MKGGYVCFLGVGLLGGGNFTLVECIIVSSSSLENEVQVITKVLLQ
jgi:hypothetical protein